MTTKRKSWSPQEDSILKYLREEKGIKRWKLISKILESEYDITGRNQKQCRDRYQNYLKLSKDTEEWTEEDEKELIRLHSRYGNKWVIISKHFPKRTGNFIKNKFYAKLRKGLRKVDQLIITQFSEHHEIQLNVIFKICNLLNGKNIIQHSSDFFSQINFQDILEQLLNISQASFSFDFSKPEEVQKIKKLINDLIQVERVPVQFVQNQQNQNSEESQYINKKNYYHQKKQRQKEQIKVYGKNFQKTTEHQFMESQSKMSSSSENNLTEAPLKKNTEKSHDISEQDLQPLIDCIEQQEFSYDNSNPEMREINSIEKFSFDSLEQDPFSRQQQEQQCSHEQNFSCQLILNQINMQSSDQNSHFMGRMNKSFNVQSFEFSDIQS